MIKGIIDSPVCVGVGMEGLTNVVPRDGPCGMRIECNLLW
jgi:hypothetical protein